MLMYLAVTPRISSVWRPPRPSLAALCASRRSSRSPSEPPSPDDDSPRRTGRTEDDPRARVTVSHPSTSETRAVVANTRRGSPSKSEIRTQRIRSRIPPSNVSRVSWSRRRPTENRARTRLRNCGVRSPASRSTDDERGRGRRHG